jgi:predicted Zn-ribbon and HTH transcriptional regulator
VTLRYFYYCIVCQTGFWYDKGLRDNNVECLTCGTFGHEKGPHPDLGVVVNKVHRIQVAVSRVSRELLLPSDHFECPKCDHEFGAFRGAKRPRCPECKTRFENLKKKPKGPLYGIQPGDIPPLDDPSIYHDKPIATLHQLSEYKRITGDEFFRNTDKNRALYVPKRNPDSGKIRMVPYSNTAHAARAKEEAAA